MAVPELQFFYFNFFEAVQFYKISHFTHSTYLFLWALVWADRSIGVSALGRVWAYECLCVVYESQFRRSHSTQKKSSYRIRSNANQQRFSFCSVCLFAIHMVKPFARIAYRQHSWTLHAEISPKKRTALATNQIKLLFQNWTNGRETCVKMDIAVNEHYWCSADAVVYVVHYCWMWRRDQLGATEHQQL